MSCLDGDDYATLTRIEDHLRRIADALERPSFLDLPPGGWSPDDIVQPAADPNQCDPGCTRPSLHDGDCTTDPLDESDHRPRHFPDGEHLRRYACGHWHMATRDRCNEPDHGDGYTLAWWDEPLTFCDCP